jgi:hypothetical protein
MFSRPVRSGWKPGAELEQRRQPAPAHHPARRGAQRAGDALEQRALARAVVAEEGERLALAHLERDVVERLEHDVRVAAGPDEALLGRLAALLVDLELLGDVGDLDGGDHQISSAKLSSSRLNSRRAP